MKAIQKIFLTSLFGVAASFASAQEIDPNTYYYKSGDPDLAASYTLSDGTTVPTAALSTSTNLVFNKIGWMNYYKTPNVKSIAINATGGTFNLNGNTWVGATDDIVLNFQNDYSSATGFAISQAGNNTGNNGFKAGGNLVLTSSKYMNIVFQNQMNCNLDTGAIASTGKYYFNAGGQMQFNHTGDEGFIRFTLSEAMTGGLWPSGTGYSKGPAIVGGNLGGLSGKGVFTATKWLSTTADITFVANAAGEFTGGEFTGAFTRSSTKVYTPDSTKPGEVAIYENSIGSTASMAFVMNSGKANVKQTINLQSAKTFFGADTTETDMEYFSVEVKSGNLEFNSELAINKVTLAATDDTAFLKFSSKEKVGEFVIESALGGIGGNLVYSGALSVQKFTDNTVVDPIDDVRTRVVFSAADLSALALGDLSVINYDELTLTDYSEDYDANNYYVAVDSLGNVIGGNFYFTNFEGAGSLMFQVPEPATVAAIFGMAALALAAWRRRK